MSDIDDILDKEDCASTYCGAPVHEPAKYERARLELAALLAKSARRYAHMCRSEHDVDAVCKAVYPVWCATTPRESWSDMEFILRRALARATGGV